MWKVIKLLFKGALVVLGIVLVAGLKTNDEQEEHCVYKKVDRWPDGRVKINVDNLTK